MSKKIRLILSICILALCVGTLTFGVLAAVTKNNQVIGDVNFSAEDCDVAIYASTEGALNVDGQTNSSTWSKEHLKDSDTWTLPVLCFDESNYPTVPDIKLIFEITNNSTVAALHITTQAGEIPQACSTTLKYDNVARPDAGGITIEPQATVTIEFSIRLINTDENFSTSGKNLISFNFSVPTT